MRDPKLEQKFPNLAIMPYEVTSPSTRKYNCIAWAAGDNKKFWWPKGYYWPEGIAREETLECFIEAFESLGYTTCDNGELVEGVEKIAFYSKDGKPTHAARQLENGKWTSKCGAYIDISHTLNGVCGEIYGQVSGFMERERDQEGAVVRTTEKSQNGT